MLICYSFMQYVAVCYTPIALASITPFVCLVFINTTFNEVCHFCLGFLPSFPYIYTCEFYALTIHQYRQFLTSSLRHPKQGYAKIQNIVYQSVIKYVFFEWRSQDAPFFLQVIYGKNQKTIAMIQSHHRILSLDSSHCVIWFIEFFFSLLYI